MQEQEVELDWLEGDVPVSRQFDDPYFSKEDGLAETEHVFLAGNGLPGRYGEGFHIAELGFGSGLNLLAALHAWREAKIPGILHFTSFEAYPMASEDMIRTQATFPALRKIADELAPYWRTGAREVSLPDLMFTMVQGDARLTLPGWREQADAWFLDGFSPAKNPAMWEAPLLAEVGAHTRSNGTAATYTAAGFVRRGLAAAGFDVSRVPGFGRKRHMTIAKMP